MKVFISWSGPRSHAVADLLDGWLQCVLQAVKPWMSSKDIDRGSLWFSEISDQLKDTNIGIVCLTHDNKNKPWILFESGALAKGLSSSRVCTFLVDLQPIDVDNPLAQFNHTLPERDSVYALVCTLNSLLGEQALKGDILDKAFNTYWPQFESGFAAALEANPAGAAEAPRSEESMLIELLRTVRSFDKRVRHLERDDDHARSVSAKYAHDRRQIVKKIEHLIATGMPPDVVMDVCRNEAPDSFIHRCILRVLEEQGDEIKTAGEDS